MLHSLGNLLHHGLLWQYHAGLLRGIAVDLAVFVISAVLAIVLAVVIGATRLSHNRVLRGAATSYAEIFRNTPEYIFLVWVYYVVPIVVGQMLASKVDISPYLASVLALGVAYSGFLSETVRAGFLSVPRAHIEAGLSLGLSRFQTFRLVVAPQALRRMLPEAVNQLVSLFKATSIVSLIAVPDLMHEITTIDASTMRPLPLYTGAAVLYCVVIISASQLTQRVSRRWRQRGWT